jgi:hypothetical protein
VEAFDIYVAYISWGTGGKMRPVLVFEQQEDVVFVFYITSQYENKSQSIRAKYFKIEDWRQAGLDKQSYIDTNTVRDLPVRALDGRPIIGKLTEPDIQRFIAFLNK